MLKNILCILLLSWIYLTETTIQKNTNTLEKMNQTLSKDKFNSSKDEISQPILKQHNRYIRSSSDCEDPDLYFDEDVRHCCKRCPEGQHVEESCAGPGQDAKCKACVEGTFLMYRNYLSECKSCSRCDSKTEVEEVRCSATRNAQCSCKEDYYQEEGQHCLPCMKCQNREITKNCSKTADTVCGECLPGFYEEENECQPCHQLHKQCENSHTSCSPLCAPVVTNLPVGYILAGALLVLLLPFGGLLIHKHKRKKKHSLGGHVFTVNGQGESLSLTKTSPETRILLELDKTATGKPHSPDTSPGHVTSVLQKSCTLYDIIDCVPIRRWKEFMRTLELPDKEIEMVEVEICNFRDQQYEMLRRWCQLKMGPVDSIYHALDRMNLSGCAEELKAKIEHYS